MLYGFIMINAEVGQGFLSILLPDAQGATFGKIADTGAHSEFVNLLFFEHSFEYFDPIL